MPPPQLSATYHYSSWMGMIFVFNLIVGAGALTLPAAFIKAGWLQGVLVLIFLAVISFMTVTFVVESISCANALTELKRTANIDFTQPKSAAEPTFTANYSLDEQIELGGMAVLYFNNIGRTLFYLTVCVYLFGDLAIYATAISKTLCDITCLDQKDREFTTLCFKNSTVTKKNMYRIYVLIFVFLVGPFGYFNVKKTKWIQLFTTTMRWAAFILMITLAFVYIYKNGPKGHPDVFNIRNFPPLFGASIYSFMCHHSIPALVCPFADKKYLSKQLAADYLLSCAFYILLALTGIFTFEKIHDLYTLNFVPPEGEKASIGIKCLMLFLKLFPVFTLSSSFPIIMITLRRNLECLFLTDANRETAPFVVRRLVFPTVALVPPVLISLYTHNLSALVKITGSYAGAGIQYFIPAFLVFSARRHCKKYFGESVNEFASPFKHVAWFIFVICWATLSIVMVTVLLISDM